MISLSHYAKVRGKICLVTEVPEYYSQLESLLPSLEKKYPDFSFTLSNKPPNNEFAFVKTFYREKENPVLSFLDYIK